MNEDDQNILVATSSGSLPRVLRGEEWFFSTPSTINDDMKPTDQIEFLERGLYPLVEELGTRSVQSELEQVLQEICIEALGVYCAHQCFFVEIRKESRGESPLLLNRNVLPRFLASKFAEHEQALHALELQPGDLSTDRPYKVTVSGMRILARDYGIDWGMALPSA